MFLAGQMKHTPGPWNIEEVGLSEPIVTAMEPDPVNSGRVKVKVCIMPSLSNARGDISRRAARIAANTRLIAAAPELFNACKALIVGGEAPIGSPRHIDTHKAFAMIRSAISKAEGMK